MSKTDNPPRTLTVLDIHYNKIEIDLDKWTDDIYQYIIKGFSEFATEQAIIEQGQGHGEAILGAHMVKGSGEIKDKLIKYLQKLNNERLAKLKSRIQQDTENLESIRKELGVEIEEARLDSQLPKRPKNIIAPRG